LRFPSQVRSPLPGQPHAPGAAEPADAVLALMIDGAVHAMAAPAPMRPSAARRES
jgi:hypothetical protein